MPVGSVWAAKAAGRCRDCQSAQNLCADPPQLLIHQYLNRLDPDDPLGNLVSIKAYLLTQVQHCILIIAPRVYRCALPISGGSLDAD